jgi:hypothetical protein
VSASGIIAVPTVKYSPTAGRMRTPPTRGVRRAPSSRLAFASERSFHILSSAIRYRRAIARIAYESPALKSKPSARRLPAWRRGSRLQVVALAAPLSWTQTTPRNTCVDFSFRKTKIVLRSFHGVPPKPTGPQRPQASPAPLRRQKIWRTTLWIWIYCNPLKSHKTAKTFLGKAWHWNWTAPFE